MNAELELVRAVEVSSLRKLTVALRNLQSRDILHRALMKNFDKLGRQTRVSTRPNLDKANTVAKLINNTVLPSAWDMPRNSGAAAAPAAAQPYRNRY